MADHHPATTEVELRPARGGEPRRVVLRSLRSADDYARGEFLQEATWGRGFLEIASANTMKICQQVGGLAAGAFDEADEMVGFIFGVSGVRDGRRAHWSHVMAVRPEMRGLGLGRRLKTYQRDFLLEIDVEHAYWSYDPLVSRNAHLNLNRLGAEPVEYVRDMYGDGDANQLHAGIGTDRFIVEWRLRDPRVERILAGGGAPAGGFIGAAVVNAGNDGPRSGDFELPDDDRVYVEIPGDVYQLKKEQAALAARWRRSSRRAFLAYLERGYRVRALVRVDERSFYVVERG